MRWKTEKDFKNTILIAFENAAEQKADLLKLICSMISVPIELQRRHDFWLKASWGGL